MKAPAGYQLLSLSRWQLLLVLVTVTLCTGCGNELVQVTGKLLLDGEPLREATVTFIRTDGGAGRPASGFSRDDGTFQLTSYNVDDGLAPGEYKITVVKVTTAKRLQTETTKNIDVQELAYQLTSPVSSINKDLKNVIPVDYGNIKTTPFSCKIPPEGKLVFDLDSSFGAENKKKR